MILIISSSIDRIQLCIEKEREREIDSLYIFYFYFIFQLKDNKMCI